MRALVEMLARSRLTQCERGATAVEYGFLIALIVLAIMAAINTVATKTTGMWNNVADEVTKH